ncbi:MAG: hypothetical protein J5691_07055 [Bacilli bacterium]|nr:hypothetical protein [Bacilli bacterium]
MATCVRCKKEIDQETIICPYCGAKQNMYIDANKVVSKSLIDGNHFDPKKDVLKTPKVEIIIDDSDAAKPVFFENTQKDVALVEELPNPDVMPADLSDYKNDIDMTVLDEEDEDSKELEEDQEVSKETPIIEEVIPIEKIRSRKVNILNVIFNLIINAGCLFLVGFGYFYETRNMFCIQVVRDVKRDLENIAHLSYTLYAKSFGLFSLFMALVFLIIYIVKILINRKKDQIALRSNYFHGLSIAFIVSTLFFNVENGLFKFELNYFFRIYSYLIMALIIINLFVNMICRCVDPLNLTFRWGFMRYNLENKESLPKLNGMNSSLIRRKIAYILIVAIVMFNIYLGYLISINRYIIDGSLSIYGEYVSRYIDYKASFDGSFNIFRMIKPMMELFFINGYGTYTMLLFIFVILACICLIAKEFVFKKKECVVKRTSSIIYIITIIAFFVLGFRSLFTLISILDGAGVNENVPLMIRDCMVAQSCSYLVCIVLMILDKCLNKNIIRKELSIYR